MQMNMACRIVWLRTYMEETRQVNASMMSCPPSFIYMALRTDPMI